MRVLLVGSTDSFPPGTSDWLQDQSWAVERTDNLQSAANRLSTDAPDAVVVGPPTGDLQDYQRFVRQMDADRIATVVVGAQSNALPEKYGSFVDLASRSVSKEELAWRLSTLTRFQVQVRRMEQELEHMEELGRRLNRHFREIDDEMRLAARLQRDFLPRNVENIGPLSFSTLFNPASWVSGDIFDIKRLDEKHVGFYIADAVGHGMAAGLLTMFIKRSMAMKKIIDDGYLIPPPDEALRLMNESLVQYTLPNCQFVTATYCLVNTETLKMRFARGGHPYPLHFRPDGHGSELKSVGGLMGLFEKFECSTSEVQLAPGDKVVLYTDGIECAFDESDAKAHGELSGYQAVIESFCQGTGPEVISQISEALETHQSSLHQADDITLVVMEVNDPTTG
jgi:phosphoserine phosphatase RsbU/P